MGGYPSAKLVVDFKKEFQQINVDIDKDVHNVDPTKLCKCYLKLYCWQKENGDNISNRSSLVFDFKDHSDNECLVCENKSGRPAKSVKIVERSETFDIEEAAQKFGFYLFVDSSLSQNKYFGMLKNINQSLVNIKTNNIKEHEICADEETYNIVNEAMEKEMCLFTKDSPQFLLWEQQNHHSNFKNTKDMSWHPLIIRWCLCIYLKSACTYKHLCRSPFLFLHKFYRSRMQIQY